MKFNFFTPLPPDAQLHIDSYLNTDESIKLAQSNQRAWALLQEPPKPQEQRKLLHLFLAHVVRGEYQQVQSLLKKDLQLLIKKEDFCDRSERHFKRISGFQYALWALDKHLWQAMLACLPQNKNGQLTAQSLELLALLEQQLNEVKQTKVHYQVQGRQVTEVHYNFALISELHKQVRMHNAGAKPTALSKQ